MNWFQAAQLGCTLVYCTACHQIFGCSRCLEWGSETNMMGVVLYALPVRKVLLDGVPVIARDYAVDQSKKPVLLTLFRDF